MSELKPCQCDLNLLNDRILNLGSGLATMPENGTMQVNKTFLTAIMGYMEELLGMRRYQEPNEPLTCEGCMYHDPDSDWPDICEECKRMSRPDMYRSRKEGS